MNETVQQYVQRIQGKIAGRDPLRTQSETAKRLSGLLKRGTPAKLQEQWKLFGVHAERGEESIERLTQMIAGHDLNHLEQIESILAPKRHAVTLRRR